MRLPIWRLKGLTPGLKEIEEYFINEAEQNTEIYLQKYINLKNSFNGNYICSDLFKEVFEEYSSSVEKRKEYSRIIHNTSVVLANEMFYKKLENSKIKECIYITGVPGAGKSFLIQSLLMSNSIDSNTIICEGNINGIIFYERMKALKNKGIDVSIIVVNCSLELAQGNVINRYFEIGRGASSETMARVLANIPIVLEKIKLEFPDTVLGIYNKIDNNDIECYLGWEYAHILNKGSYEEILERLLSIRKIILERRESYEKKSL